MTIATLSTSAQQCINSVAAALTRNKTLILQCIGFTFLWGLVAHGYCFANENFSFDSLMQLIEDDSLNSWKAMLGRIFVPQYEFFTRGFISIPWLIGTLALCYISLALFLICKIFHIRSIVTIFLTAGILTVNITTICLTTIVISDFDADMLAMLLSVIAVYLWNQYEKGYLWGSIPLFISLGLYQSYISTAITLIIIISIWHLLQGKTFKQILYKGLLAILMICCAGILYVLALYICTSYFGTTLLSNTYNSLNVGVAMSFKDLISITIQTYLVTCKRILCVPTLYRQQVYFCLHLLLVTISILLIIKKVFKNKKIKLKSRLLFLILLVFMPIGMNISKILANGMSHDIMHYAIWLHYIFILLIAEWNSNNGNSYAIFWKYVCHVGIIFILCKNIQLANTAYFIKDLENTANISFFTRIISDIEKQPEYTIGETNIALIGHPSHLSSPRLQNNATTKIRGMSYRYPSNFYEYVPFFEYILMYPANIVSNATCDSISQNRKVQAMPLYPAEGSIQMIDDVLVVKLGEVEVQP